MAATNPLRVSDLIRKYGWEIMVYLSNLGPTVLAEAQVLFVDSGHTNALDADDGEHGHSLIKPLATWDYANSLCTASEACVIFLAPGHNENLGDAQIDLDVIGVHTIGIGSGSLKPRIDYGHVDSSIDVGANNVTIQNVDILPSLPDILIGVHVETDVTDFHMKDVRFLIGEDGAGADEFVKAVEMTSGNDDCVFEDVIILAHASAGSATHGIHVAAAADRTVFRNVVIDGPYATGGIVEAAAGENLIVENCAVDVTGTNYSFNGASTFAKRVNNVDGQVREDDSESLIVETRGSGTTPTGITDESIFAYLMGSGATASASTFNNTTDSLQAIAATVGGIGSPTDVTGAVPVSPTLKSLQDILSKAPGSNNYSAATDSLEAIADAILTGTNILAGVNLDHLMKTAVVDEQNMAAEIANGSALAHILVKGAAGSTTDFDPTTDSLEAIADAVTGFTTAVSTTPTARSVQDILEKDGGGTFLASTDSLEAISDLLRTGTVVLAGLNLDHLMLTAVVDEQDMSAEIATGSALAHILVKGASGDVNDFDPTTDSLQAIRDNQQAAARAAIDDAELDHLCELDGTAAYAENIANDSIIAKIMCVGSTATANTYNNTTDSLQAIAAMLTTGTTALSGIKLDHLVQTVAAGTNYPSEITTDSILAMIMSDDGIITGYDKTTHSLEAIGDDTDTIITDIATAQTELDKIGTIVNTAGTATIGGVFGDFANSSLVARLGNLQTDADQWGALANTAGTAELGAMLGDFANVTLVAQIAAIVTDLTYQEQCVEKVATSTDDELFDVTGEVLITSLIGIVTTTPIGGVQNEISITLDATDTLDHTFSTSVETNGDAVGTRYVFSAANPAVLTPLANGSVGSGNPQYPWVCRAGVIEQVKGAGAGTTGQINWYITYKPLSSDGAITAAS